MTREADPDKRYVVPEGFYYEEHSPYRPDEPQDRITRLASTALDSLYKTVMDLNWKTVELATDYERSLGRVGELVIRQTRMRENGLYDMVGLDYLTVVKPDLFPYGAHLAREIDESDLAEDDKLLRLANLNGVMIAESQSFTIGNKRTARAFYGRIRFGIDRTSSAQNALIDFVPPEELERTILLQNLARLATDTYKDAPDRPHGGIWVGAPVEQSLEHAIEAIDAVRFYWGKSENEYRSDASYNSVKLRQALEKNIPDKKCIASTVATLYQEDYGPAAYSLVTDELDPSKIIGTITPEIAKKICDANTLLLKMRIKSLMAGLACGGRFVIIENSSEATKERVYREVNWEPSYTE